MTQVTDDLHGAREAVSRYAWGEAFGMYAAVDAAEALAPDDLDPMAECAWWIGKMRHCIALRERAHTGYLKAGVKARAARVAIDLAGHHADLTELSAAEGWVQRAARLLAGAPESVEHGWLAFGKGQLAHFAGDDQGASRYATEAARIAARHGDKDLFALSVASEGMGLTFGGDAERGLRMVEEATVGAVAGELGPRATGMVYCMMITAASQLADWQRAGQWTEAAKDWCDRQAINGFPGVCRVHRAEIMRLRGDLSVAEEESRTATVELGSFNLMFAALAFKELGEVRLKMGDLDGAEEAFHQASEMGVTPQPGLALAQVQRGNPRAAAVSLKRALADTSLGPLDRAKLLPAQVEIAVALGDLGTARSAAAELEAIAASHSSPGLRAAADTCAATVGLADAAYGPAELAAQRARRVYDEIDLTYEAARVSLLLGQICQAKGDADRARSEIGAALSIFDRIGAMPDADRARELLI
jgi:hypothetical protein